MKRYLAAWAAGMILALLPASAAMAAQAPRTIYTSETLSFEQALSQARDGDTINISAGAEVLTTSGTELKPVVIDKSITITGGELGIRKAGILLEADVTFRDMRLAMANNHHDAIFANGYTLTIDGVTCTSRWVDLFGGSLYTIGGTATNPVVEKYATTSGTGSRIVVQGSNSGFGHIYAGSMNGANDLPVTIDLKTTIKSKEMSGSLVYGCGAMEGQYDADNFLDPYAQPEDPVANARLYPSRAAVSVQLGRHTPVTLEGETGGDSNVSVIYEDDGKGYRFTPVLKQISGLQLIPGRSSSGTTTAVHLTPAAESSFAADTVLQLPEYSRLDLTSMGAGEFFTFGSLQGGGILILESTQSVEIQGEVSGTTGVAIGDINYDGSMSTGTVWENHTYVLADSSTADSSFVLLPPSSDWEMAFSRKSDGGWWVGTETDAAASVRSISMGSLQVDSGTASITLPLEIVYANGSDWDYITDMNPEITINGISLEGIDDGFGPEYRLDQEGLSVTMYFTIGEEGEVLAVSGYEYTVLADGTYHITVMIPADKTESGQPLSASAVLQVGEAAAEPLTISYGRVDALTAGRAMTALTPSVSGGDGSYHYALEQGAPAWLQIGETSGVLSGTPMQAAESVEVTVIVTDGAGQSKRVTVTLPAVGLELEEIRIQSLPSRLEYQPEEVLEIEGLAVMASYSNGTETDVTAACSLRPAKAPAEEGTHTVTVYHEASGKTAEFSITVKRPAPIAQRLELLDQTGQSVSRITVPVSGSSTYTLKIRDQYGEEYVPASGEVTWSAVGTDDGTVQGIAIAANGSLTVSAEAAANRFTDRQLQVVVTGRSADRSVSVEFSLVKEASEVTGIAIRDGVSEVVIPPYLQEEALGTMLSRREEKVFRAVLTDQYGDPVEGESVVWSVSGHPAVSIDSDGRLTVSNHSLEADGSLKPAVAGEVTVAAAWGEIRAEQKVAVAMEARTPLFVYFEKEGHRIESDVLSIPASGTVEAVYRGLARDQYGDLYPLVTAAPEGSLPEGITASSGADGTIRLQISPGAEDAEIRLQVESGGKKKLLPIRISAKPAHNVGDFAESTLSLVYGAEHQGQQLSCTTGGILVYRSGNESILSVDAVTGALTATGVGSTVVTASVEETEGYHGVVRSYEVTIAPKTVRITGLRAEERAYLPGDLMVALTDGVLEGVRSGDQVSVQMPASGAMEDADAGVHKKVVVSTPVLEGEDAGCYILESLPELEVTIRKAVPDIGEVSYQGAVIYVTTPTETVSRHLTREELTVKGSLRLTAEAFSRAGEQSCDWIFVPEDGKNYEEVTGSLMLEVRENLLTNLRIEEEPEKSVYTEEESFDITGLVVLAEFADGSRSEVTEDVSFRILETEVIPGAQIPAEASGETAVKVIYTVESVTKTAEFMIEVIHDSDPEPDPTPDPEPDPTPDPEPDPTPAPLPFTDVPGTEGTWKYDSIYYVWKAGIMNGISGTSLFQPDHPLTRAMFATVLYRMAGTPEVEETMLFTDLKPGQWYTEAVIWVKQKGIVDGYSNGAYGIQDYISRDQIAKMLFLYGQLQGYQVDGRASLESFTDVDTVSSWAVPYMQWAVEAGMISGKPNDDGSYRLDCKGKATRAECAKMLKGFLEHVAKP